MVLLLVFFTHVFLLYYCCLFTCIFMVLFLFLAAHHNHNKRQFVIITRDYEHGHTLDIAYAIITQNWVNLQFYMFVNSTSDNGWLFYHQPSISALIRSHYVISHNKKPLCYQSGIPVTGCQWPKHPTIVSHISHNCCGKISLWINYNVVKLPHMILGHCWCILYVVMEYIGI